MLEGESASVAISDFMATVAQMGLNITCNDCSGPKILELSSLLEEQAEGGQVSTDVTDVLNSGLELINKLIEGEFFRVFVDRLLNDAKGQCPHSPFYNENYKRGDFMPFEVEADEESIAFFVALIILLAVLVAAALVLVLTTKVVVRRRHRKWMSNIPSSQVEALWIQQQEEDEKEADINARTDSMFRSTTIPRWIRLFMPVVILGNIGFFLSGHLSLGASVSIIISLGGQTSRTDNFYEFSMARSTVEIWNGKK